ncbi:GUCY1B3 [Branchiostoma lanceolatum]|uniref:guanylate cyclase n=1 Tax=Branchiostoma lanceolatum TaxID=7740 RepID=A0A8K0EDD0_BRALA|nr:GUCY1B3 [Branchiostoma lanceolatum]CAH1244446.1 GUCY1B3 [Branchiostoma lanceolatum]
MVYGFINLCLKSLVVEKFGEEAWENIRREAEVEDNFMTYTYYDDVDTMTLIDVACRSLAVDKSTVLMLFGEFFFEFCVRSGYDHMLRTLGENLVEFIENLDSLHSYLTLAYDKMNAPSFRLEKVDSNMFLHYYSDRKGLAPMVIGIVKAVARAFFQSEVTMDILSEDREEERTRKKEHVVFSVTQRRLGGTGSQKPPKYVAQSHKGGEQQIRKEDVENVLSKLAQQNGVCPFPGNGTTPKVKAKRCWDKLRGIVTMGKLTNVFQPIYPDDLWVDPRTFCNILPFHIIFDQQLQIKQSGINIQRIVPGIQTINIKVNDYFELIHPEIPLSFEQIKKFINSQFILEAKRLMMPTAWGGRPTLQLRGQMIWMPSIQCMIYMCSPKLTSLKELEERNMYMSEIALHDVTRDLILLNQQRLAEIELAKQLEEKKEELRMMSEALQEEQKRTDMLLYSMLPRQVANKLREGRKVEAGEYDEVTILFSDIVTFTNICAMCKPIQIVQLLNEMYLRFDRLTTVHDVYKVETIGDAYMVVGGLPVPVKSHAERVANMGLGMQMAAGHVKSPVTGKPIQIRVGIHTGPVVAGVVGEKMPRYCLFGDTVNTASRMESHGVPGKVHISPATYKALRGKSFIIKERGEINVKGKGPMYTYYVVGNGEATEDMLMGRPQRNRRASRSITPSPARGKGAGEEKEEQQLKSPASEKVKDDEPDSEMVVMLYKDSHEVSGQQANPPGSTKTSNGVDKGVDKGKKPSKSADSKSKPSTLPQEDDPVNLPADPRPTKTKPKNKRKKEKTQSKLCVIL